MTRSLLLVVAVGSLAFAQDQAPTGWRRVGDRPPQVQQPPVAAPPADLPPPSADPEPIDRSDAFGQPAPPQPPMEQQPPPQFAQRPDRPAYGLPPDITVRPGTFLTIRISQPLSSDHNQPGDPFVGSLAEPVVVDGIVVANRNQLVYGRVAEAEKAHSDRPSRLALQLTSLTLADGTQMPIRSRVVGRRGGSTPVGDQVGTVATTTAVGATIGGIAAWGTGAAIGAGAGALAGIAGVILTRNHPTIVYPESVLTFDVESPVTISTVRAPHAFRYVGPEDYQQAPVAELQRRPPPRPAYGPYPYAYPAPYPYPYYYGPGYYGGVGVGIVVGRGYGYGYGRGYGYGYGRYHR